MYAVALLILNAAAPARPSGDASRAAALRMKTSTALPLQKRACAFDLPRDPGNSPRGSNAHARLPPIGSRRGPRALPSPRQACGRSAKLRTLCTHRRGNRAEPLCRRHGGRWACREQQATGREGTLCAKPVPQPGLPPKTKKKRGGGARPGLQGKPGLKGKLA